jgi:flagellar basal body-associated protein FliL
MSLAMFLFTYKFNDYIANILSKASGKPIFIASSIIIIFICIAVVLLSYAFGALNRHRFDSKKNNTDKQELDAILKLYNIEYDFKIFFKDRMLMSTDIKTELKLKNLKV